jgi:hypothetical protein
MKTMKHLATVVTTVSLASLAAANGASAFVAAHGGGTVHTEDGSANVSRSAAAGPYGAAADRNVTTANGSANRTVTESGGNVDVNRNVQTSGGDVNVNHNYNASYSGYHGASYGSYDAWGHPVAYGAAAGAAAVGTAIAVGTVVSALPSSGCEGVSVGGVAYQRCGGTYYQPTSQGSQVTYVVVNPP